ncbi:MAG: cation transporting ATPase C-terminal domain-containing protein, partial [Oscillospiraceae bacterium]
ATLVNAVDEGRSIYDNIRKFIRYLLACNIGEVMTMFVGMLMGMPVILLPIQILLINLVTDGLPAIALGLEPASKNAMSRPPRKPNEGVFSNGLATKIVIRGLLIGLSTLASFVTLFKLSHDLDIARSGALFALIFAQLIHVFECKSETKNLLHIHYTNNIKLILATSLSLIVLLVVLYCPPIAVIFSTVPLTLSQVIVPIGYCFIAPIANIILHPDK